MVSLYPHCAAMLSLVVITLLFRYQSAYTPDTATDANRHLSKDAVTDYSNANSLDLKQSPLEQRSQTGLETDKTTIEKLSFKDTFKMMDKRNQAMRLVGQGDMPMRSNMDSYRHLLHRRSGHCQDDEFECALIGLCISLHGRCNGNYECNSFGVKDLSDELNCEEIVCREYQCPNTDKKICIYNVKICDGSNDCPDGWDEQNCKERGCYEERCPNTGRCIQFTNICDIFIDCTNNWDEKDCQDGKRVCPEEQCPTNCPEHNKNCPNTGQCIPFSAICNTITDCFDRWDEENCVHHVCPADNVKCPTKGQCIRSKMICDGTIDCPRGWDEENCTIGTRVDGACPESKCPNSVCIPFVVLCNTVDDCIDGWDERFCADSFCPNTMYKCNSGQCVTNSTCTGKGCMGKDVKCNGERECTDGSDEANCPDPTCISSTAIKCETGKTCFDEKAKCNGTEECLDGSDESNCSDHPPDTNSYANHGLTAGVSLMHTMCITLWLRLFLGYI